MTSDPRLDEIEARLARVEAVARPPVVYVVLSQIRNVEVFRDRDTADSLMGR